MQLKYLASSDPNQSEKYLKELLNIPKDLLPIELQTQIQSLNQTTI
jgi:hypothetical protein